MTDNKDKDSKVPEVNADSPEKTSGLAAKAPHADDHVVEIDAEGVEPAQTPPPIRGVSDDFPANGAGEKSPPPYPDLQLEDEAAQARAKEEKGKLTFSLTPPDETGEAGGGDSGADLAGLLVDSKPPSAPTQSDFTRSNVRPGLTKLKSYPDFIFDLEDSQYFFSGENVTPIGVRLPTDRRLHYLVDYHESPSLGLIDVPSDIKYAEVIARKRLEERGDLTADHILIPYSKRKTHGGVVSVLYQVAPYRKNHQIVEIYDEHPKGFFLHDTVSLLCAMIGKMSSAHNHALAMHLGDSILVVSGRGGDIKLCRRYTLLGDDNDALDDALLTIFRDLESPTQGSLYELQELTWIEPLCESLDWNPPMVGIPVTFYPMVELTMNRRRYYSALPLIMRQLKPRDSVSSSKEIFINFLERHEYQFYASLLVLYLIVFGAFIYYNRLNSQSIQEIELLENDISSIVQHTPAPPTFPTDKALPVIEMSDSILMASGSQSLAGLWNRLAMAKPKGARVNSINCSYTDRHVKIELKGEIVLGLTRSQSVYTAFLNELERDGFALLDSESNLSTSGLEFSLQLQKPLSKG